MEFLIISGLSGAGKSQAAAILEDLNFYCVDNMPVVLIPKFAELCLATRGRYDKVALVTDVRSRESFEELFKALDTMKGLGCEYKILFIEAGYDTIVKRYKENRRRHPLNPGGGDIESAVRTERRMLETVRTRADYIIDTTGLTIAKLQGELRRLFAGESEKPALHVNVMSFGFKYGIPIDADLVFDVRFLPNPFYVERLREMSGLDKPVSDFVFDHEAARKFMEHLKPMIEFLLPLYIEEGKYSLMIAIGCTGGHHRSVAITEALGEFIAGSGYIVENSHRDIDKS